MFKIGSRVQAIDPLLGTWLNASITALSEQEGKVEVKWNGYTRQYNCWIKVDKVRWPEEERALDRRRPILQTNWTAKDRGHPKFLQGGDDVEYLEMNDEWVRDEVVTNDCFRCEVVLKSKRRMRYELLRKIKQISVPSKEADCQKDLTSIARDSASDPEPIKSCLAIEDEPYPIPTRSTPINITRRPSYSTNYQLEDNSGEDFFDNSPADEFFDNSDIGSDTVECHEQIMQGDIVECLLKLEKQQETILANQQAILDQLNGISGLLNERAKRRGLSLSVGNSNTSTPGSSNHSKINPLTTSTVVVDTNAKAVPATSPEDEQTHGKITNADTSPSFFPMQKSVFEENVNSKDEPCTSTAGSQAHRPLLKKNAKTGSTLPDKIVKENKACLKEIRDIVGNLYTKEELAESSFEGGKRKYNGIEFTKNGLSPFRLNKAMKSAQKKFPEAYGRLKDTNEIRETVNMKCRKTSKGKSRPIPH